MWSSFLQIWASLIAWKDPKFWNFFALKHWWAIPVFSLVKHKSVDYVGFDPIAECPCFFFKACATTCFLDDDEYST